MRELKYPENYFCDNRKKVSDVLEELGYHIKREPDKVTFRYIEERPDGIRESMQKTVMDFRTIVVSERGEYMVHGEVKGCHIGMAMCFTRREVEMLKMCDHREAGGEFKVYEDIKRKLLIGILLKLLVEQFDADNVIKYEIDELQSADYIYIRAGVKVTEHHRLPIVPKT